MSLSSPSHPTPDPRRGPEGFSREYLASQRWTADRVREELVDECHPVPRYEFVGGELLASPSPEYLHRVAARELFRLIDPYVRAHGLGEVAWSPSDVAVAPDSTAQPDLFVVLAEEVPRIRRRGHRRIGRLTLAVEILSRSSRRADRLVKRRHYTSAGVPEYGVIDLDARVLEVSRAGDGGRYEPIDDRVTWHPDPAPEPLMIDVAGHFERVLGPETA